MSQETRISAKVKENSELKFGHIVFLCGDFEDKSKVKVGIWKKTAARRNGINLGN